MVLFNIISGVHDRQGRYAFFSVKASVNEGKTYVSMYGPFILQ